MEDHSYLVEKEKATAQINFVRERGVMNRQSEFRIGKNGKQE